MRCFNHPEAEAVAICTACTKGVCRDCAVDLQRATACRGRCENEVRRLLDLRDFSFAQPVRSERLINTARRMQINSSAFLLLMGGLMLGYGIYRGLDMLRYMGIVLAGFGVMLIFIALRGRVPTHQFRICAVCGYNVSGNTTGKCPECGTRV